MVMIYDMETSLQLRDARSHVLAICQIDLRYKENASMVIIQD